MGNSSNFVSHFHRNPPPDDSSVMVIETGSYQYRHGVYLPYFYSPWVHHLEPIGSHPPHLLMVNFLQFMRFGNKARISSVDAVHISVYMTHIGSQTDCQCHSRGIRTTTSQGGDVQIICHALQPGHYHYIVLIPLPYNTLR